MSRLRRRVEALERRLGTRRLTVAAAAALLTDEEREALAHWDPPHRDLAQRALLKVVNRCGHDALVLAAYERRVARLAAAEP